MLKIFGFNFNYMSTLPTSPGYRAIQRDKMITRNNKIQFEKELNLIYQNNIFNVSLEIAKTFCQDITQLLKKYDLKFTDLFEPIYGQNKMTDEIECKKLHWRALDFLYDIVSNDLQPCLRIIAPRMECGWYFDNKLLIERSATADIAVAFMNNYKTAVIEITMILCADGSYYVGPAVLCKDPTEDVKKILYDEDVEIIAPDAKLHIDIKDCGGQWFESGFEIKDKQYNDAEDSCMKMLEMSITPYKDNGYLK